MEVMERLDYYDEFKSKKVLITGYTGFRGSRLINTLNILGA